jgi:hypothetical protein
MATKEEAINACNEVIEQNTRSASFSPSLITPNSREELLFLENYLIELEIKENVWIGAKRVSNNSFKWDDDSDIDFSNWAGNSPSDDLGKGCAQMQSSDSPNSGQWIDSSCDRQNMIVCQKLQIWTFPGLQKTFLDSRRKAEDRYEEFRERIREKDDQIASLLNSLQEIDNRLLNINSDIESFKGQVLIAVNNSYQQLFRDNEEIRELLRIKGSQIVQILQEIDYLKGNASNPSNPSDSQIESLRNELLAVINSKFNELDNKIKTNTVKDVRLEIVNYRRTLQILKNDEWISIGYVN